MNEETKQKPKQEKPLKVREISFDGLMKAADVELATGLSRVTLWRLEREKKFPTRVQLSPSRVGWHGNEVKNWMESRPRVNPAQLEEAGTV